MALQHRLFHAVALCFACFSPALTAQQPPLPFLTGIGTPALGFGPWSSTDLVDASGVACDSQGNIYVAEWRQEKVKRFTAYGTYLGEWTVPRRVPANPAQPWRIDVGPADEIYVLDRGRSVWVFDVFGTLLRSWGSPGILPSQFSGVWSIAVGATEVYVLETSTRLVKRFTPQGTYLGQWSIPGLSQPRDLKFTRTGELQVLSADGIYRYSASGNLLGSFGRTGSAPGEIYAVESLAIDAQDNVYVADRTQAGIGTSFTRLQKFSSAGQLLGWVDLSATFSETGAPYALELSATGLLYLGSSGNTSRPVMLFGATPFAMAADRTAVGVGELLRLRSFAGPPSRPAALFLSDVNGIPFDLVLGFQTLSPFGEWDFRTPVPYSPPASFGFSVLALDAGLQLVQTNRVVVNVL